MSIMQTAYHERLDVFVVGDDAIVYQDKLWKTKQSFV